MLTFSSKPRGLRPRRVPTHAEARRGLWRRCRSREPWPNRSITKRPKTRLRCKGWHDSSGELKRGLDVTENVPLDTLPAELRADFTPRRR